MLEVQPGLALLPLRRGAGCRLAPRAAATLEVLSRKLRIYLTTAAAAGPGGQRPDPDRLRAILRADRRGKRPEWLRAEAIPSRGHPGRTHGET
jgi:hypothetical protein